MVVYQEGKERTIEHKVENSNMLVSLECTNIRKSTGEQVENEQEILAKGLARNAKKFQLYTISNESLVTDFFS